MKIFRLVEIFITEMSLLYYLDNVFKSTFYWLFKSFNDQKKFCPSFW